MRYVLLICVCAIAMPGMPAAFAAPKATSGKHDSARRPPKHKLESARHKPSRARQNQDLGGIHPLVGSGDY
jgi:hypothetical protein